MTPQQRITELDARAVVDAFDFITPRARELVKHDVVVLLEDGKSPDAIVAYIQREFPDWLSQPEQPQPEKTLDTHSIGELTQEEVLELARAGKLGKHNY